MERIVKSFIINYISITGKITIFKTLAISKIMHLSLIKVIPPFVKIMKMVV